MEFRIVCNEREINRNSEALQNLGYKESGNGVIQDPKQVIIVLHMIVLLGCPINNDHFEAELLKVHNCKNHGKKGMTRRCQNVNGAHLVLSDRSEIMYVAPKLVGL
ncbi:hypothetical protein Y032_0537g3114 [Ancylostoma ceylanicum]|uniref:Uncharacterized protein n=1 Tax=Ancylostoma ceylanicum TaxID=53326 RepID=A0A016WRI3_9BILA|nr:hypothetical protein Y032_0537g3114 [Ancylostoma ceylanicum]